MSVPVEGQSQTMFYYWELNGVSLSLSQGNEVLFAHVLGRVCHHHEK